MDFQELATLRQQHPAWRLLRADHAPLIISFLEQAFVIPNQRSIDQHSLASRLKDLLYSLHQTLATISSPVPPAPTLMSGPTTAMAGCANTIRRALTRRISS